MGGFMLLAAAAAAAAPGSAPTIDCAEPSPITWRVENGFAIFRPTAQGDSDALLDAIAQSGGRMQPGDSSRASAYDAIVARLVDDAPDKPALYRQTWWDRAQERYVFDRDTLVPDSIVIRARFAAGGDGDCSWSVDGGAPQQLKCGDAPLTLRRGGGRLHGTVTVRGANAAVARGCATVTERLIVGLGDSYASGEGNPDRPTRWELVPGVMQAGTVTMPMFRDGRRRDRLGTWDRAKDGPLATAPAAADAQWWDNTCHRSLLSQQALAALSHAAADRHRRVLFLSFACSGATVFDGVVGPRLEPPGLSRRGPDANASPAVRLSQLEQLVPLLCDPAALGPSVLVEVPDGAPTWQRLAIRGKRPASPWRLRVPTCGHYRRQPDALLLSIGGNDIGFGGVGAWALLPPKGRVKPDIVPAINKVFGGGAVKQGFGLVCPGARREGRCPLNSATLVAELPAMFTMLDDALAMTGLKAPVRLQSSYPLVTQAEDRTVRGCFGDELGGELYELLDEPWLPTYAAVLDRLPYADWLGRWSFGIQTSEMDIIHRRVLAPLNAAVTGHSNWTVIGPAAMPVDHGICAADGALATGLQQGAGAKLLRPLILAQFGWPRFVNGGWSDDRPKPADWRPYAVRARWVRTATDSALTQSVLDDGTGASPKRARIDRLGDGMSGAIHPALPLHAAMAEALARQLEARLN